MTSLETHFASYSAYHQTKGNKLTHYVGIPLIVFSTFGLLQAIPLPAPDWFSLGLVAWLASTVYYLRLDWKRGLPFSIVTLIMYLASRQVGWVPHVVIFIVGWILQGIGHYKYEKKSPAFLTNLTHLLIGPFWIYCGLVGSGKGEN